MAEALLEWDGHNCPEHADALWELRVFIHATKRSGPVHRPASRILYTITDRVMTHGSLACFQLLWNYPHGRDAIVAAATCSWTLEHVIRAGKIDTLLWLAKEVPVHGWLVELEDAFLDACESTSLDTLRRVVEEVFPRGANIEVRKLAEARCALDVHRWLMTNPRFVRTTPVTLVLAAARRAENWPVVHSLVD
jgi:hypothetical protein